MTPDQIKTIAQLLAGDAPGWQARFGTMTGLSRTHVSQLLSGVRPLTQKTAVKIIDAAKDHAAALRDRADELDGILSHFFDADGRINLLTSGDDE